MSLTSDHSNGAAAGLGGGSAPGLFLPARSSTLSLVWPIPAPMPCNKASPGPGMVGSDGGLGRAGFTSSSDVAHRPVGAGAGAAGASSSAHGIYYFHNPGAPVAGFMYHLPGIFCESGVSGSGYSFDDPGICIAAAVVGTSCSASFLASATVEASPVCRSLLAQKPIRASRLDGSRALDRRCSTASLSSLAAPILTR